jgi:hypothetical protein
MMMDGNNILIKEESIVSGKCGDAERAFLASRTQRRKALQEARRAKDDQANDDDGNGNVNGLRRRGEHGGGARTNDERFWSDFQQSKQEITSRLHELQSKPSSCYTTAAQRQQGRRDLQTIQDMVTQLQNVVSQAASSGDLPSADIKKTSTEIQQMFDHLQTARDEVSPPGKFEFSKYRQTNQGRQQSQPKTRIPSSNMSTTTDTNIPLPSLMDEKGGVLTQTDETVLIEPRNIDSSCTTLVENRQNDVLRIGNEIKDEDERGNINHGHRDGDGQKNVQQYVHLKLRTLKSCTITM